MRSSSLKMALLFTLLLGGCGFILGWLLHDFGQKNFIRETEAAIDSEIANIQEATLGFSFEKRAQFIASKARVKKHPYYLYQDIEGTPIAGNIGAPRNVERLDEGLIGFIEKQRHLAAKIHTFSDGSRLLVARNIETIIASYERLQWLSLLMFAFMLTVIGVSFLISYFVVSRINRISDIAGKIIETGDLSQRIPIDSKWDDLSSLGEALNLLLSRIELLMQDIRDVADNIAHDLRTPLTRMHGHLEGLQQTKAPKNTVRSLLAEADGLLTTFNALLRISNIEKGKRHQPFEAVNLQPLLQDVIELYEPLAEEKGITFHQLLDEPYEIMADRDLLFQAFANLLDNAIKFSPEGGEVEISLAEGQLTFADQGIGVSAPEKEKLFDRFYRSEKSRHTKGSGLGLSLVKAVLELHQGAIRLEENNPGLRVVIEL